MAATLPNSYGQWQEQPDFSEPSLALDGSVDRWNFREDDDGNGVREALIRLGNVGLDSNAT